MKFNIQLILLFFPIVYFSCIAHKKSLKQTPTSLSTYNPVVAHRGAWKATGLPENSSASLKEAIHIGCIGSETDVHMTDDSAIVVHHDPKLNQLEIQSSNLADLRKFKLSNGEELPLLSDLLKIITTQDYTKLVLEIKPSRRGKDWAMSTVKKVVDEVNKYDAQPHIIYISFDYEMCREILKLVPGARVQYLNGDKTPAQLKDDGISGLDYHYSVFEKHPEYISEAKKLGLKLDAWTVNDAIKMNWLIENDFDFITTNEPELLFQTLKERKK